MRPLETVLLLANLLAFLVLAVSLPRAVPWMRHLAPITLAIAVAQVLVEGPRSVTPLAQSPLSGSKKNPQLPRMRPLETVRKGV
jgi:hypothetical protein